MTSLPIIALTAEVGSTVKEEAMKSGCSTLINKPANAKDIIACLASLRGPTSSSSSSSNSIVSAATTGLSSIGGRNVSSRGSEKDTSEIKWTEKEHGNEKSKNEDLEVKN